VKLCDAPAPRSDGTDMNGTRDPRAAPRAATGACSLPCPCAISQSYTRRRHQERTGGSQGSGRWRAPGLRRRSPQEQGWVSDLEFVQCLLGPAGYRGEDSRPGGRLLILLAALVVPGRRRGSWLVATRCTLGQRRTMASAILAQAPIRCPQLFGEAGGLCRWMSMGRVAGAATRPGCPGSGMVRSGGVWFKALACPAESGLTGSPLARRWSGRSGTAPRCRCRWARPG
jgi:hypothetical protein